MCGIIALQLRHQITKVRPKAILDHCRQGFTEMLVASQRRGSAATGVVLSRYDYVTNKNTIDVIRAPLPAREFVKTKEYQELIDRVDNDTYFIFGHTRAATTGGAKNNHNNHPHKAGRIIGVHNGHINNHKSIWNKLGALPLMPNGILTPTSTCDSEAIFALIEQGRRDGLEPMKATKSAAEQLEGWFAFMHVDADYPYDLQFVKDHTTDLEFVWVPNHRITFVCSEERIILDSVRKRFVDYTRLQLIPAEVHTLKSYPDEDTDELFVWREPLQLGRRGIRAEDEELFERTRGGGRVRV